MSRPVVALCTWADFNYAQRSEWSATYDAKAPLWSPRDEPPEACRASLGEHRLTVWLPRGARIHLRTRWYRFRGLDPMTGEYTYTFGTHDRMSRKQITITLTELPITQE